MVVTDMKECRLEKKRTGMGEALLEKVAKLDATLASDLNDWKQDMCETNSRLQQKISKLQASLKLCEKQVKTKDLEIENLTRDRKRLENTLASVQEQVARDKQIKEDMEMKNNVLLWKVTELQNSLLACEEWKHLATQEAGSLFATQYNMEKRIAQLEDTLTSERVHQEKQKERLEEYVAKLEKLVAVLKTTLPSKKLEGIRGNREI
ncbi:trichohyalin-like [Tachysurus ichikawai]